MGIKNSGPFYTVCLILVLSIIAVTIGGLSFVYKMETNAAKKRATSSVETVLGHRTAVDGTNYVLTNEGWKNERS